ncbi:MAG: nucleotidyltransferase domain-containing protein [Rectinemataceae bacterium]
MGLLKPVRLSKKETARLIEAKLQWLLDASQPSVVVLFGSAARGGMTEASDPDLALVYPDDQAFRLGRKAIFCRPPCDSWPTDLLFSTQKAFGEKVAAGGLYELIAREGLELGNSAVARARSVIEGQGIEGSTRG